MFDLELRAAAGLDAYTGTGWTGRVRTRKSTSGGCLVLGRHLVKAWSSTLASIALSSGTTEYYGVVLGMQALYNDYGLKLPIRAWSDSSAALGIGG